MGSFFGFLKHIYITINNHVEIFGANLIHPLVDLLGRSPFFTIMIGGGVIIWLVVWNHGILWLSMIIYWECHHQWKNHPNWRTPSFFRGVGQPPTRLSLTIINHVITININHILTVDYQPIVGGSTTKQLLFLGYPTPLISRTLFIQRPDIATGSKIYPMTVLSEHF